MELDIDKAKFIQRWGEDPGWRAFIGFIAVPVLALSNLEFRKVAPEGFATAEQHMYMTKDGVPAQFEYTVKGVRDAAKQTEHCAMVLKAMGVDLIAQCGAAYNFCPEGGLATAKVQRAKIEKTTGIPTVFSGLALPFALKKMGYSSVAISSTVYPDAWRQRFNKFLEDAGIKVLGNENFVSLGFYPNQDAVRMHPTRRFPMSSIYRSAKMVANQYPEADCIVSSAGGVCTMDILEPLETDLRKPVISATAAMFFEIFYRLGVFEPILGRGSLLASLEKGP